MYGRLLEKTTVKHYDIQTAFLHGNLSYEVYMKQPPGYQTKNKRLFNKLKKNLYRLKQDANKWNRKLYEVLIENSYERSENDPCLYSKCINNKLLYISIQADDIIAANTESDMLKNFEKRINKSLIKKSMGDICNIISDYNLKNLKKECLQFINRNTLKES